MATTTERIAEKLKLEGEKTAAFFEAIQPSDWDVQTYADGQEWTIRQILTHITEAERSVPRLIAGILGGGAGSPDDFDLDRFNESRVTKMTAENITDLALIALFQERRAETIRMVEGMSEDDLSTEGRHPFLGWSRVEDMVKLMYMHVRLHQRDIQKKLSGG